MSGHLSVRGNQVLASAQSAICNSKATPDHPQRHPTEVRAHGLADAFSARKSAIACRFYQHVQGGSAWDWKIVWAHASSSDLVHWRHEPMALQPTPGGLDGQGCWSGNTMIAEDGTPTILYTMVRSVSSSTFAPRRPLKAHGIPTSLYTRAVDRCTPLKCPGGIDVAASVADPPSTKRLPSSCVVNDGTPKHTVCLKSEATCLWLHNGISMSVMNANLKLEATEVCLRSWLSNSGSIKEHFLGGLHPVLLSTRVIMLFPLGGTQSLCKHMQSLRQWQLMPVLSCLLRFCSFEQAV